MKKLLIFALMTYFASLFSITPEVAKKGKDWAIAHYLAEADINYLEKKPLLIFGQENYSNANKKIKNTQSITVWNGSMRPLFAAVYEEYDGKKPALFGQVKRLDSHKETTLVRPEWSGSERRGNNNRNLYYSFTITDFDIDKTPKDFLNVGEGTFGSTNKFMLYPVDENGDIQHSSQTLKGSEYDKKKVNQIESQLKAAKSELRATLENKKD